MRTFKEYYNLGLEDHLNWLSMQKEEWWKRKRDDYRTPKGDYIETVCFLNDDEKNNASMFDNHTNVKNREWSIFFFILGQALVDWCVENKIPENIWSFHFSVDREIDGINDMYHIHWAVYPYDKIDGENYERGEKIENPEQFDDCAGFLADLLNEFMTRCGKDIPNDWNYFSFGLDDLQSSIEYGQWVCFSDGYMNLGNINWELPEKDRYESFIECM